MEAEEYTTGRSKLAAYWDKNPGKFRVLFSVIALILLIIIATNFIRNATTVFSGTHYMMLPSSFYIQKPLQIKDNLKNTADTIPTGSFLLMINDVNVDSIKTFENQYRLISSDSVLKLFIFSIKDAEKVKDNTSLKTIYALSKDYYVKKSDLPPDFFRVLNEGVYIGYVLEDGATKIAGLRAGDVLLSINDTALTMMRDGDKEALSIESLRHLRSQVPGVPVSYKILRDNNIQTLDVRLAKYGFELELIILLILGMTLFILGTFYALKRPELIAARLTGMAFLLMGFEICASYNLFPAYYDFFTDLKIIIVNIVSVISIPVILHSLNYFPKELKVLNKKKIHFILLYSYNIFFAILIIVWYLIDTSSLSKIPFVFVFMVPIIYYITIRIKYGKYESADLHSASVLISGVWIFVYSVSLLLSISSFLNIKIEIPYFYVINILFPAFYLYVTWRYKLLDINFRIKRNIQYTVLSALLKTVLLVLFIGIMLYLAETNIRFPNIKIAGTNVQYFNIPLEESTNQELNKIFFMLSGLILVFIFIKFNKFVQNFFDKNFYRGKYDYAFAQSKLSDMLEKNFSIEDLSEKLVKNICTLARLKTSAVYIFCNDEMNWSTRLFIYDNVNRIHSVKTVENEVFDSEKRFRGPVTLDYVSESTRKAISDLNIKYIVPLKIKDKYLGLLFIGEKLSESALRNEDLEFINSLSSNAAVSIDNTIMYEKLAVQERIRQELEIAHKIQVASLPQSVPEIKGLDIAGYSIPALEVGGDFYDFLNGTPGKFTVVVGDVSGKGTSAALYMSKVQGIFQTLNEFYDSPKKLLTKANHILFKHIDSKSYITAIGANFDTKNNIMRIARAGHLPLFYYSKSVNEIRKVQPAGIGLGIRDEKVFDFSIEEIQIEYRKGDIFLFVTDGITESLNTILEQYGDDRLMEILKEFNEAPAEIICAEIIKSVKQFSEKAKQHDDITLVTIKTMI